MARQCSSLLLCALTLCLMCYHTIGVAHLYDDSQEGQYYDDDDDMGSHNASSYAYMDELDEDMHGDSAGMRRGVAGSAYAYDDAGDSYHHGGRGHGQARGHGGGSAENPEDGDSYEAARIADRQDIHPLYEWDNCQYVDEGRFTINGTAACDILVAGVDAHADQLEGGLDGRYALTGCFDGKPTYVRMDGPPGEERALSYNDHHGDWEFNIGPEPSEDHLVLYSDVGYLAPTDVAAWHLAVAFSKVESLQLVSEDDDVFFVAQGITVVCAATTHNVKLHQRQQDADSGGTGAGSEALHQNSSPSAHEEL